MSRGPFYVTTAIFYANAGPHLGSALEIVASDAFARFKRLQGFDVFLLTGTDEHGQKIAKRAAELGIPPGELVDRNAAAFQLQFGQLNVEATRFIRTTEPAHHEAVRGMVETARAAGDLYKGTYHGWYCLSCEAFWSEAQKRQNLGPNVCPTCGRILEQDTEEVWFFRQSRYGPAILEHIRSHPGFIEPEGRAREIVNNFLAPPGLEDLAVSRSRRKVPWGIPFPDDPDQVVYVWFDALTNYLSGNRAGWPADVHVVGKDILRFHATTWPAMLLSAGLPLPGRIFAHGWVLGGSGAKMSKSEGNVIDPEAILRDYRAQGVPAGVAGDVLRYALLREAPLAQDFVLTGEVVQARYARDLANDLGNLVHRTLSMAERYFALRMPGAGAPGNEERELAACAAAIGPEYEHAMEAFEFNRALELIWSVVARANRLVEQTRPWDLAKDPGQRARLEAVISALVSSLQSISVYAWPVLPDTCRAIRHGFGLEPPASLEEAVQGGRVPEGRLLHKGPPLFPRAEARRP